ncbi:MULTISPECIES: metallophosphoesterase [Prevotellaceae]|uniref:metallophosphoesterase n=1 Tax=Prevotellaceae TaxID=171552 RepID=UPI0003D3A56B|nr:metallophosphoesterase [Prevotella phocaeensis]ETD19928.1 hypothetical protein HMPREF1199_00821 [Hoylesella oralis CC98A]
MIARIFILLLLLIVLPDLYIGLRYFGYRLKSAWWRRLLWWLQCFGMVAYTVCLASLRNFVPDDLVWIDVYLLFIGIWAVPKAVFALCSSLGLLYCRLRRCRRNVGSFVGLAAGIIAAVLYVYGTTVGFSRLEIRHVDIYMKDLPATFNGYKIVQFSDAHVGTFYGSRFALLKRDVDSINAQKADAIFFTGDLQNIQPSELRPHARSLASLQAKDGVYSVLGNHDYSEYIKADAAIKDANEKDMVNRQRQMGWKLLRNEHISIHRGKDSIVVVGTENDGRPPFPQKADLRKALRDIEEPGVFKILLQHDPSSWDRHVLPQSNIQLTLCGHTHAGQLSIFGWRPTELRYKQDYGLYRQGDRYLYVTAGIGGVVPFRLGSSAEIAVITLHKTK